MLEMTIAFCSVLVIYFDHHKKSGKLDYNLIFGSIENDLLRISHFSYLDESASLPFQRSLESTEFCLCCKGLPLLGSSKSCTAVSTEPWYRICWKKFHLLNESRVIFLYNYIKIRGTEISDIFCRPGSDELKPHETVLYDSGMILTYKYICPACCSLSSHLGSDPSLWI